jgi:hypothetical protein
MLSVDRSPSNPLATEAASPFTAFDAALQGAVPIPRRPYWWRNLISLLLRRRRTGVGRKQKLRRSLDDLVGQR